MKLFFSASNYIPGLLFDKGPAGVVLRAEFFGTPTLGGVTLSPVSGALALVAGVASLTAPATLSPDAGAFALAGVDAFLFAGEQAAPPPRRAVAVAPIPRLALAGAAFRAAAAAPVDFEVRA